MMHSNHSDKEPSSALDTSDASYTSSRDSEGTSDIASIELARKETRAVHLVRAGVLTGLIIAAVALSAAVLMVTNRRENDQFESMFEDHATSIINDFHRGTEMSLEVIESLAVSMASNQKRNAWPFVTLPDFESLGATSRNIAEALFIFFSPLIHEHTRTQWELFSVENSGWIEDTIGTKGQIEQEDRFLQANQTLPEVPKAYLRLSSDMNEGDVSLSDRSLQSSEADPVEPVITSQIYQLVGQHVVVQDGPGPYLPLWKTTPVSPAVYSLLNYDLLTHPGFQGGMTKMLEVKEAVVSEVKEHILDEGDCQEDCIFHDFINSVSSDFLGDPVSRIFYPVFDAFNDGKKMVGVLTSEMHWSKYFTNVLPPDVEGIICVVENTRGQSFTYEILGQNAVYLGQGDLHDDSFDGLRHTTRFAAHLENPISSPTYTGLPVSTEYCQYTLYVYPSKDYKREYVTYYPLIYTALVIVIFALTTIMFFAYDCMVEKRQAVVTSSANRSNALVSSIFPSEVRKRMFGEQKKKEGQQQRRWNSASRQFEPPEVDADQNVTGIAESHPNCTVFFADIVGFTAWSAEREPPQTFELLEAIFGAFDKLAKKRGVFKVETIGDCYMAVTGLPQPQPKHALIMARFARDCFFKFNEITRLLETSLGPDTGDLALRVGLHSGPVTAGVLRGEKTRFQLFGDTVNTSSRMESNGRKNRIHASQETVDLLNKEGKENWITPREDKIFAKGKGELQTYWVAPEMSSGSRRSSNEREDVSALGQKYDDFGKSTHGDDGVHTSEDRINRLVDWNVDLLLGLVKQMLARRRAAPVKGAKPPVWARAVRQGADDHYRLTEIIRLPDFNPKIAAKVEQLVNEINVEPIVISQLRLYVLKIAEMYHNQDNHFHNFEHASHVILSSHKLLLKVVKPRHICSNNGKTEGAQNNTAASVHDHSYGINSDPLTHFALLFAALIHDVDHRGVPDSCLAEEVPELAAKYKNKNVARQNSLDIALTLLFTDNSFAALRACLFASQEELDRFRQLVVNAVLATDILDKNLQQVRRDRWDKAFSDNPEGNKIFGESESIRFYRKATIVIEYIMQASDVAHMMQHWTMYQKWNGRLFDEFFTAYQMARVEKDPSEGWYQGEMWFFDNYIIPLAEKLQACNVFGIAGDQCLNFAIYNRAEWKTKGEDVVAGMIDRWRQRNSKRPAGASASGKKGADGDAAGPDHCSPDHASDYPVDGAKDGSGDCGTKSPVTAGAIVTSKVPVDWFFAACPTGSTPGQREGTSDDIEDFLSCSTEEDFAEDVMDDVESNGSTEVLLDSSSVDWTEDGSIKNPPKWPAGKPYRAASEHSSASDSDDTGRITMDSFVRRKRAK